MEGLERILSEHPFFETFPKAHRELLAGCAKNHRFNAGQFLFHEGDAANEFFLIRHGKIALEIVAPGREPIVFETLQDGDIVGASWLVPPYRWMFDKCEADHHLGYEMMKRFLPILVGRLHATRLQILDVYGKL
jgi:signal-transduction protein with cAMP-binding, CBS, and nucleotidyltransferase domain